MPIKTMDHNIEEWKDVFQIDRNSPSGVSWNINGNNKVKGKPCGWKSDTGHWKCEYKNKSISLHRVVFYLANGYVDSNMVVDHIDQNPSNNVIENLRIISPKENFRNKKKGSNNVSGVNGVHEIHKFVATWSEDGKAKSKDFRVSDYGVELAKEMAIKFRENKIEYLNSLGYNYSDIHGL